MSRREFDENELSLALFVSCHMRRHHTVAVAQALANYGVHRRAGQHPSAAIEDLVTSVLDHIGQLGGVESLDLLSNKTFDSRLYSRLYYIIQKAPLSKDLLTYISEARGQVTLEIGRHPSSVRT